MRDVIVLAILLGSVPVCLVSPSFGMVMWFWVTYFNPHRFAYGAVYNFPAAMAVAVPTLIGAVFTKKTLRSLMTMECLLLMALWAWFGITYLHAQGIPLFAGNMADADYEMGHISKILLMTIVMITVINSRERLRNVVLVTAGSMGVLAVKTAVFGARTGGTNRAFGPPNSFLAENNAYGLALVMSLPLLFFLVRDEPRKWLRVMLRIFFGAAVISILLTYSRGDLLGLGVVATILLLRSRHKLVGVALLVVTALFVVSFAPPAWSDRMGNFLNGNLDDSANMRLTSWTVAWRLSQDFPMGGSFDAVPNVDVYKRYQPHELSNDAQSSGPHSIYFQLLGDQGFVGLGIFLMLMFSCLWSLFRVRGAARSLTSGGEWMVTSSIMIETSIVAFMISGAFLGVVYVDVIYEMIGLTIVLKMLCRKAIRDAEQQVEQEEETFVRLPEQAPVPALAVSRR